ncbi:MAG: 2-succinyl-6-hydroxy-2,4-cyclohexadiene-1-carboxylate synthase [Deltaproteobacteria bacterium]|jgi:2-succinyl-6-hydroxy-2,4-cyclohexadiene-1-carboxylate synthase|nr:2-succinyl-6-hydroxy-2,4-cyclohexadiene-1-carboxylate synthase [Deltaproteobacteria bacterium]MBW2540848.1 2-succinyl-6-hydroxy-2,4-cyclohexadiene-1-carboxylate synthase [Deltaproteobacteria bacterium]
MTQSHDIDTRGVRLHVEEMGSGSPVVLLHGFTGSTRAMAFIAEGLSDAYRTLSIDLVGHGRSAVPDDIEAYSMTACVAQLVAVLDELDVRAAHWIGYSMGGRVALSFGVAHPERMASALLIGTSAGVRDLEQRAARIQDDEELAERIERDGVEAFVDFWISQDFLVDRRRLGARGVAKAREMRLANSAKGLADSLRGMGAGAQPPIHAALSKLRTPVCLVVGEDDLKFSAIAAELSQELPNPRVEFVPEAGHAAHSDNPATFLKLARRFLADAEAWNKTSHCAAKAAPTNQKRTK